MRVLIAARVNTLSAGVVSEAAIKALKASGMPVETITLDNGSEMAEYKAIEKAFGATVYFADPHSPWQRGTNENFNGQLRFFFPRGTDLTKESDEHITAVVSTINNRPRLCLGLRSHYSLSLQFLHFT